MDSSEQAAGEVRVKEQLIDPLMRRGLAKPSTLTIKQFAEMIEDIAQRLAYMAAPNLAALEEIVAANPGGKDRDRLPISTVILSWAADIQPPGDTASPLMRAVFAAPVGLDAIRGGWSPELLGMIRRTRKWPNGFALTKLVENASGAVRDMKRLDERVASGADLPERDRQWRDHRLATLRKCEEIRDMSARAGE